MRYTIRRLGNASWADTDDWQEALQFMDIANAVVQPGHMIIDNNLGQIAQLCDSCQVNGEKVQATTTSFNPDFSGYDLCQKCATEYNSRVKL